MSKVIGVVGKTERRARSFLLDMVDDMRHGEVERVQDNGISVRAQLANGDVYETWRASETMRGVSFDMVWVDSSIDRDLIDYVVRPCVLRRSDLSRKIGYF